MTDCTTCGGTGQQPGGGLVIMSRQEAGLRTARRRPYLRAKKDIKALIVHHNGPQPSLHASVEEFACAIQRYHMVNKGWTDLQYNFVVGRCGTVINVRGILGDQGAEGETWLHRPYRYAGAGQAWGPIYGVKPTTEPVKHDFGTQAISVICQLGDTEDEGSEPPTPEMTAALVELREYCSEQIGHDLFVDGHRSHRIKSCPGKDLSSAIENGRLGPWPDGVTLTTPEEQTALALAFLAAQKKGQA